MKTVWDARSVLNSELDDDEILRWIDRPSPTQTFFEQFPGIALSLLFMAMPAYQIYHSEAAKQNILLLLFISLFVILPLYTIALIFCNIAASWRMVYAITNKRILIITDLFRRQVFSFSPGNINIVERTEHADGSGTVRFRRDTYSDGEGTQTVTKSFVGVRDARTAAREIERLLAESREDFQDPAAL